VTMSMLRRKRISPPLKCETVNSSVGKLPLLRRCHMRVNEESHNGSVMVNRNLRDVLGTCRPPTRRHAGVRGWATERTHAEISEEGKRAVNKLRPLATTAEVEGVDRGAACTVQGR
jgi:hypothetical protein